MRLGLIVIIICAFVGVTTALRQGDPVRSGWAFIALAQTGLVWVYHEEERQKAKDKKTLTGVK